VVLTSTNAVHYLMERGLLDPSSVVDGDIMILEAPRRNRNFKVIRRKQPGFFLKQVKKWDQASMATLQVEAHCYQLAASHPDFAALGGIMPRFYAYDASRSILVTELVSDSESVSEHQLRSGAFPVEIGARLGEAFGLYHRETRNKTYEASVNAAFPRRAPWILSYHQTTAPYMAQLSGGNVQLLNLLQSYPAFAEQLDRIRTEWRPTTLIHGDIKWDNCILHPNGGGQYAVKVVDWELADWGDPCWDVAAIFSQYLSQWIHSLPLHTGLPPSQLVEMTQLPMGKLQPSLQAFWLAYSKSLDLDSKAARTLLERSMRYTGARMIQTAYEYMQSQQQLTPTTPILLQACLNILSEPKEAITELLGL
jgi:hypothetical protein